MPDIEKKLRIQLFDEEFNMLSDRLVSQYTEFGRGPGEVHEGPLKIEVCLFSKEDVDQFKTYLETMRGHIPMDSYKAKRGRKKAPKDIEGFRDYIAEQMAGYEALPELITMLREQGFLFSSLDLLKDMGYPIQVSKVYRKYKFMVRLLRKAKNPANDKYDPSLLIGIKGGKVIGISGEDMLFEKIFDEDADKMIKIPAKAKVKFPDYLNQDERNKFRSEMQLLKDDPERNPTGFYKRWVWEVKQNSPEGIEFPRIETIPSPY